MGSGSSYAPRQTAAVTAMAPSRISISSQSGPCDTSAAPRRSIQNHLAGSRRSGRLRSTALTFKRLRRRVMLKVSGEALQGENGFGVDPKVTHRAGDALLVFLQPCTAHWRIGQRVSTLTWSP